MGYGGIDVEDLDRAWAERDAALAEVAQLRAEVARLKAAMPTAEELESLTAVIDQAWVYDRALARGWLSRVSKGGE